MARAWWNARRMHVNVTERHTSRPKPGGDGNLGLAGPGTEPPAENRVAGSFLARVILPSVAGSRVELALSLVPTVVSSP
jgi:hypothetical protein